MHGQGIVKFYWVNEVVQHAPKMLNFSSFRSGRGSWSFSVLKVFHIIPLSFQCVPIMFPMSFQDVSQILNGFSKMLSNSTSLLSHVNLCPKLSFWTLHRQAKEVTAIFLPWEWKLIFGSVSKVSFFLYLFSSFLVISQSKRPTWENKIWTWEAPTTKYSLSRVNGMSAHPLEKWLLKYQIHQICRLYQNFPFCG
jgi:hypothetical protein